MIEVPAIVPLARRLRGHVDFVSIGTNDLTQHVTAVDRERATLSDLGSAMHPGLLWIVRYAVTAARRAPISVSVCGEIASDTRFIPWLLGIGISEISVAVESIPAVVETICGLEFERCRRLAEQVGKAATTSEVRELLLR
jgi:phosphoenolpyruvate-protein kinase (PTS system EI component)